MIQVASQHFQVFGVGNSMQGGRPENQDDWGFVETPIGLLLVVCDGMGGGPGGKTASYIAKYEILSTISQCNSQTPRLTAMKMAVSRANDAMEEQMAKVPALRGMGSTVVALLISEQSAVVAHLGDSRCYQLRGKKVKFRTQDHSLVGELVRNKAITEEQARVSPQSNVITRGLGNTSNHVAEVEEIPYRNGDRFLLCTDGVWGIMPHEDLLMRFTAPSDIPTIIGSLSEEIDRIGFAAGGHHDNHTIVMVETRTNSLLKEKMSKQVKIILTALSCLLAVSMLFNIIFMITLFNSNGTANNDNPAGGGGGDYDNSKPPVAHQEKVVDGDKGKGAEQIPVAVVSEVMDEIRNAGKAVNAPVQGGANAPKPEAQTDTAQQTDKEKPATGGKEVVNSIISSLSQIEKMDKKDFKEAVNLWDKCVKNVKQQLTSLDEKTKNKFHDQIAKMQEIVNGPNFDSSKAIWKKDPKSKTNIHYVTAPKTKTAIAEMTKELNDISSKL